MPLTIYNTLTHQKELFVPINSQHVGMYVCGPTVYDKAHIGNVRPIIIFDVLYRLLKQLYSSVVYVRNITDIDDKINIRAMKNNESISTLTSRTIVDFHADIDALNALRPSIEPRATAHIQQMINIIQILIDRGHAYEAENHVLFSVPSMLNYGILSRRNQDKIITGARVEVAPYKKNASDFVLWKPSFGNLSGWDSPWGYGRPGWHIECSAMSQKYLGITFDIHGGGQDLIFPHHENEIAQNFCAYDQNPANYWIHNGYVMIDGEKMSKSLGNFSTVRDLLYHVPGEVIRLAMLSSHYRHPLDWTTECLNQARIAMNRFYLALRIVVEIPVNENYSAQIPHNVMEALKDDLNTPLAVTYLHELITKLNNTTDYKEKVKLKSSVLAVGNMLGILQQNTRDWFCQIPEIGSAISDDVINDLIKRRLDARKMKKFTEADFIRKELSDKGIILEDYINTTTWRRRI